MKTENDETLIDAVEAMMTIMMRIMEPMEVSSDSGRHTRALWDRVTSYDGASNSGLPMPPSGHATPPEVGAYSISSSQDLFTDLWEGLAPFQ